MLKEDIDMMPPIRLSDAETSQRTILEITKRLETDGRITISRGSDQDEFI
jgi:flagellar motor switch protein FliG